MKKFLSICLLLLSLNVLANGELQKKSESLSWFRSFYQNLFELNERKESKQVCQYFQSNTQKINAYLSEDSKLIEALLKFSSDNDIYNYAKEISNNAMSTAFYLHFLNEKCLDTNKWDDFKMKESFEKAITNHNYLQMTHVLFMEAFCGELQNLCGN